eukprot:g12787.t1
MATEEARAGLLADGKEGEVELGMKVDTEKMKETAGDIKDETSKFAKELGNEIGKTWESMRAAKFTETLNSEDDTMPKKALKCFMTYLMKPLIIVIMIYVFIARMLYKVYQVLPIHLLEMVFGVGLCFFGGVYFASIAAFEAFRNFGGQLLIDELALCWEQALLVKAANEVDDKKDENKEKDEQTADMISNNSQCRKAVGEGYGCLMVCEDGIADVEQMGYNELISHKAKMAMMAVDKPERLMKASEYLFTAWVAVIATLKSQFAKTVAIALGIADQLTLPAVQVLGPTLAMLLGKETTLDLQHWTAPIITTTIKVIAVVISSYIQAVISAFYSGLRGGRLFGEAFMYGVMPYVGPYLPECMGVKNFNPEESYIDEIVGFPFAAAGFYYQLTNGFALDFPYSIIMFPCTMDVADAIAEEMGKNSKPDAVAAAAYQAIWSEENQKQRDFAVFGGEFLMELDVAGLRGWFQGFFNLPEEILT